MKPLKQQYERTDCPIPRGAAVRVIEPNRTPLEGVVLTVKHSPVSGWWAEVREPDGATWCFNLEAGAQATVEVVA